MTSKQKLFFAIITCCFFAPNVVAQKAPRQKGASDGAHEIESASEGIGTTPLHPERGELGQFPGGIKTHLVKTAENALSSTKLVEFVSFNKFEEDHKKGLSTRSYLHFYQLKPFVGKVVTYKKVRESSNGNILYYDIRIDTPEQRFLIKDYACQPKAEYILKKLAKQQSCRFPKSMYYFSYYSAFYH